MMIMHRSCDDHVIQVFGGAVTVIHDEVTETVSIEVSRVTLLHHMIVT